MAKGGISWPFALAALQLSSPHLGHLLPDLLYRAAKSGASLFSASLPSGTHYQHFKRLWVHADRLHSLSMVDPTESMLDAFTEDMPALTSVEITQVNMEVLPVLRFSAWKTASSSSRETRRPAARTPPVSRRLVMSARLAVWRKNSRLRTVTSRPLRSKPRDLPVNITLWATRSLAKRRKAPRRIYRPISCFWAELGPICSGRLIALFAPPTRTKLVDEMMGLCRADPIPVGKADWWLVFHHEFGHYLNGCFLTCFVMSAAAVALLVEDVFQNC